MNSQSTPTCTIIITCMNRLGHLKQTLPQNSRVDGANCLVVDYSCSEHTGDWVEENHPGVAVVRVEGRQFFNLSDARNHGAAAVDTPWLFFLDADCIVESDFLTRIGPLLPGHSYHAEKKTGIRNGQLGSFVCEKKAFDAIGGYDPVFQGWGGEDTDLYRRLAAHRVQRVSFPNDWLQSLPHSDEVRTDNYPVRNMQFSLLVNHVYMEIKAGLGAVTLEMPLEQRRSLYTAAQTTVRDSLKLQQPGNIRIPVHRARILNFELTQVAHFHLEGAHNNWMPSTSFAEESSRRRMFAPARDAIAERSAFSDISEDAESPVFLLAAGVRCGSTLVQRMLMPHCFMWGEPWGRSGLVRHLVAPVASVTPDWPPPDQLEDHQRFQGDLTGVWTANMAPTPDALLRAARAYLNALFTPGARERGYTRWGVKEVRLDADDGLFLRTLYPSSKLIFLIRNPYDAYCSYRQLNQRWLFNLPDDYLDSPRRFGMHWLQLARGFVEQHEGLDAYLLRYEEFLSDQSEQARLEAYLEFPLDAAARDKRVRGSNPNALKTLPESIEQELEQLAAVVKPLAAELGYEGPSGP